MIRKTKLVVKNRNHKIWVGLLRYALYPPLLNTPLPFS